MRWIERKGFKHELVDYQEGEEAGIKSVTVSISGRYVFGYLRSEKGVHRLVRLSPFDSAHRRHTSFALVEVLPMSALRDKATSSQCFMLTKSPTVPQYQHREQTNSHPFSIVSGESRAFSIALVRLANSAPNHLNHVNCSGPRIFSSPNLAIFK